MEPDWISFAAANFRTMTEWKDMKIRIYPNVILTRKLVIKDDGTDFIKISAAESRKQGSCD